MKSNDFLGAVLSGVVVSMCVQGCQTPPAVGSTEVGAMPEDPRQKIKEAEYQEAIQGLDFEAGLVIVTSPLVEEHPGEALEYQDRGLAALSSNRFTGAIRELSRAVRTDPTRAELHLSLGRALTAKGKSEHALAAFRTALAIEPDSIDARFNLAMSLGRLGREPEAIEQMTGVLELDPGHTAAHERLAIWNYYTGDYPAAWRHVHDARDLGYQVPPQFLALLEGRMPEPGD